MHEHLLKAREDISEAALTSSPRAYPTCFAFVNEVLAESLPHSAMEELRSLHETVLLTVPDSHYYHEIIPYHYALIADHLRKNENDFSFWKVRDHIHEAMPGDIFVYIDPDYDPDPKNRKPNQPTGTHVGFVDEVFCGKSDTALRVRLVDATKRTKGRGILPDYYDTKDISSLKAEGIAYSLLSLNLQEDQSQKEKALWECQFLRGRKRLKHVSVLYLSSP